MNFPGNGSILTTPDVLIIGGGSAGVAAAAGAFRQGATVTIIEKNAFAGGKATAAYVGTVCGLYFRSENPVARFVHRGFPEEFALELAAKSKSLPLQYKNGLYFLPYGHFEFMMHCDEWLKKSAQSVCFHAQLHHAVTENNSIVSLEAIVANKPVTFRPKAVIDTSGEDLLASLLQIDSIKSDHYQAAAQVFQLSGIAECDADVLSLGLIRSVKKGISSNRLQTYFERVSVIPGSLRNGNVLLKLPLPLQVNNDPMHRSALELFSRNAILLLVSYLKGNGESFKNCSISFVAPEAGIRTGPRNLGKEILSGNDVRQCRKRINTIARGAWPMEYWEPEKSVFMEYFDADDYYDVPAGSIQSKLIANLFFGGRNLSADDSAIASARVIGTCLATGYAAGILAAFQSLNKSVEDAVVEVQKSLSILPAQQ